MTTSAADCKTPISDSPASSPNLCATSTNVSRETFFGAHGAAEATDDDQRLACILDDYLKALEQGSPITPEELLARHPGDADRLGSYLSGLKLFHAALGERAGDSWPGGSTELAVHHQPGRTIAGYRLIREIGRGGMGVVYEATELALKRRVALKVLLVSGGPHSRQIARFKNEAQAAAQVRHPNIVPVYSIGAEDGLHYYAMQLIEGESLATAFSNDSAAAADGAAKTTIRNAGVTRSTPAVDTFELSVDGEGPHADIVPLLSSTATREHIANIAGMGVQAAEALHAAHEYGVVHRDVKPSNLLVDSAGKLWVTDFGLARCRENDGLTLTGDVLGTMRYMSPEQAAGRAAAVDHRTDVYSLGVTLYELAVFRHPAEGTSDWQLFLDPARRTCKPLRHWNSHVPADFETIVLKAMAELPEERYATAQELANDLTWFLNGEPIHASRPSLGARAIKLARRRRKLVYAGLGVMAAAVAGLATALVLIFGSLRREAASRADAEASLVKTLQVLDFVGTEVSDELAPIAGAEGVRHQVSETILTFYKDLASRAADNPAYRADFAMAQSRVGALAAKLGDKEQALHVHRQALVDLQQLVAGEPDNLDFGRSLALCQNSIGLLEMELGRPAEAAALLIEAEALQRRLLAAHPGAQDLPAELAATLNNRGLAARELGKLNEAASCFEAALLLQSKGDGPASGQDLAARTYAATLNNYGSLFETNEPLRAVDAYRQAIDVQLELVADRPFDQTYQCELARTYNNLGFTFASAGRFDEAAPCYDKAIVIQQNLVKASHQAPYYCRDLAVSFNNLGMMLSQHRQFDEAEQAFGSALAEQQRVLAAHEDVRTMSDAGGVHNNLARLLDERGRWQDADGEFRLAVNLQQQALALAPESEPIRQLLGRHYVNFARHLAASDRHAEAIAMISEREQLWPNQPEHRLAAARELASIARQVRRSTAAAPQAATDATESYATAALKGFSDARAAGLRLSPEDEDWLLQFSSRKNAAELVEHRLGK